MASSKIKIVGRVNRRFRKHAPIPKPTKNRSSGPEILIDLVLITHLTTEGVQNWTPTGLDRFKAAEGVFVLLRNDAVGNNFFLSRVET